MTFKQYFPFLITLSIILLITFAYSLRIFGNWSDKWNGYVTERLCNIAVIPIRGDIISFREDKSDSTVVTTLDETVSAIHNASSDPAIDGILLKIDTCGGSPVTGQAIADELKSSPLPSIALVREAALSAGYMIATGADTIIASEFSDIGSIGVTMSYTDNVQKNKQEGINYNMLSSGKFKDTGSPDKILSAEERAYLERDLTIFHAQFIDEVAQNRSLPRDIVASLADGSSMPGVLALENKLIDSIGDQETARSWFANTLDIEQEEVVFCE